jgi:hypothetical protein
MSNHKQDVEFGEKFLEEITGWIAEKLSPEEVFSEERLREWAAGKEIQELVDESDLDEWATLNGYSKID